MSVLISASVGAAGRNRRSDVMLVQDLLHQCGVNAGGVDGQCGPLTVDAILSFQARFLTQPDGRVDPGGMTLRRLDTGSVKSPSKPPVSEAKGAAPTPNVQSAPLPPSPGQKLTTTVPRPSPESINQGLVAVSSSFMVQQLGMPRDVVTADDQPVTNARLRKHLVTQSVGRFRVTGLAPAVESLRTALVQVAQEQPAVYAVLGTEGMLCCRLQRGSKTAISNHAWGTAVDFKLNGQTDRRGDKKVQVGLTLIAPIMNQHGWYWGAAFGTEDAMHFEASRSLILQWAPKLR